MLEHQSLVLRTSLELRWSEPELEAPPQSPVISGPHSDLASSASAAFAPSNMKIAASLPSTCSPPKTYASTYSRLSPASARLLLIAFDAEIARWCP